jgi:hypothetical protein
MVVPTSSVVAVTPPPPNLAMLDGFGLGDSGGIGDRSFQAGPHMPVIGRAVRDTVRFRLEIRAWGHHVLVSTEPVNATFRGVVASVDERNDSIGIRILSSATGETTEDFKVKDGLVFDAVRFGDAVAFTVETIKDVKTITALTKE